MIDPNKKEASPVKSSEVCLRAFELMAARQFEDAEKLLSSNMSHSDDDASVALYHSTLGVLFKMRGEFKTAWKHYQRAEKLLPEDPALKIISARLLIDEFAQYSTAIRKAKKVLDLLPGNPVFVHQAHITMGLAYCRKGKKADALEMLRQSCANSFAGFVTAKNIDFTLAEMLIRKNWGLEDCRLFLIRALEFANSTGEDNYIGIFGRMLNAFNDEYGESHEE